MDWLARTTSNNAGHGPTMRGAETEGNGNGDLLRPRMTIQSTGPPGIDSAFWLLQAGYQPDICRPSERCVARSNLQANGCATCAVQITRCSSASL